MSRIPASTLKNLVHNKIMAIQYKNMMIRDQTTKMNEVKDKYEQAEILNDMSKMFLDELVQRKANYLLNHITETEEVIQHSLDVVEPDKGYKAHLVEEDYRGKPGLALYLETSDGDWVPPHILEGGMLNEVLVYSISALLAYKGGFNIFYYDEGFGKANALSLVKIRNLLQMYNDMGLTSVLVSQNPILLTGLSRNRVELIREGGQISAVEETNISGDNLYMEDEDFLNILKQMSKM